MRLHHLLGLPFSSGPAWQALRQEPHAAGRSALLLTLPLALVPPLMLAYAGRHHLLPFLSPEAEMPWESLGALFLLVEVLSVALMAWLTRVIAAHRKIAVAWEQALLLTALTAVPLWLSSLALALPVAGLMMALLVLGLALAGMTLYHGCAVFLGLDDPVVAQALACEVFAAGALLWVLVGAALLLQVVQLG